MSKKVRNEILKIRPDLGDLDGYFYFKPVGHVLCGFLCEGRPGGMLLVPYAFPLYSGENEIHLSYSKQLPYSESFVELRRGEELKVAAELVGKMERHEANVRTWQQLERFLKHIEAEGALGNPWIRRGYAMTLVMLGKRAEAMDQLRILTGQSGTAEYPGFDVAIAQVAADLAQGIGVAQARLAAWELEAKSRLGLSQSA